MQRAFFGILFAVVSFTYLGDESYEHFACRRAATGIRAIVEGASGEPRQRLQLYLGNQIWGTDDGPTQRLLTEAPDPRFTHSLTRVMTLAAQHDMNIARPRLTQVVRWAGHFSVTDGPHRTLTVYGRELLDGKAIIINAAQADRMTDDELDVLMAHEFGHCYDYQSGLHDDQTIPQRRELTPNEFANGIAVILLGADRVVQFNQKF